MNNQSSPDRGFSLCGIQLFRRRPKHRKERAPESTAESGPSPHPTQRTGTIKHPRRSSDSPREREEPEGAFQPPKRQHSREAPTLLEEEPPLAPAGLVAALMRPAGATLPDATPLQHDAALPEQLQRAGSRRFSGETRSQSFPQSRPRTASGPQTEEGPVSPRRHRHHHHAAGGAVSAPAAAAPQQQQVCPPYGHKAVIGRRPKMEDAYSAVPFLLEVPISQAALDELVPPRIASHVRSAGGGGSAAGPSGVSEASTATAAGAAVNGGPEASTAAGGVGGGVRSGLSVQVPGGSTGDVFTETLHFFGVFDGHGGADAAMHCAKTMHERVREVLSAITSPGQCATPAAMAPAAPEASSSGGGGAGGAAAAVGGSEDMDLPSPHVAVGAAGGGGSAAQQQQHRAGSPASDYGDAQADLAQAAPSGSSSSGSGDSSESSFLDCEVEATSSTNKVEGLPCTSETVEAALTRAFHMTDEDFAQAENAALVGTTAVVALVGTRMLYVANCGDSRAVLCRNGMAVALTDDHKAAREDETARVEAAGGQILFWNGVRVMGVLAVSRAIGDHCLRPFVIAQPEVTIISRHVQDELLLLASDGLWDVMNNQEACTLAKKCLQRARQRGATRAKASSIAASVLVRAAVDRGSRDNVTVVIVDLSPATREELEAEAQRASEVQPESSAMDAGGEGHGSGAAEMDSDEQAAGAGQGGASGGGRTQRRRSIDKDGSHAVPSPFATLPPTAPSPFEQMQQQQAAVGETDAEPAAPDAALLSPFGSVPLPLSTEDSHSF